MVMRLPWRKIIIALAVLIVLSALYFVLIESRFMRLLAEPNLLVTEIQNLGVLGPMLIIGLMCIAIVLNPLPSAPIALAAGAVYGHILGTIYVVAGAELGALMAFVIARWAGYDLTRRFFDEAGALQRISSQNTLTMLVLVSRLIPFMSFDLVSYAAGLSPLKTWRFAIATLLGLIPVSFALAHFGSEIRDGNYRILVGAVLLTGLITVTPILLRILRSRKPIPEAIDSESE